MVVCCKISRICTAATLVSMLSECIRTCVSCAFIMALTRPDIPAEETGSAHIHVHSLESVEQISSVSLILQLKQHWWSGDFSFTTSHYGDGRDSTRLHLILIKCVLLTCSIHRDINESFFSYSLYYPDPHPVHGVQLVRVGKLQHYLANIEEALATFKQVPFLLG